MAKTIPTPAAPTGPVPAISVTARRESFMRCGRQFSSAPTVIALSELTDAELDRLLTEPMLVVRSVSSGATVISRTMVESCRANSETSARNTETPLNTAGGRQRSGAEGYSG